MKSRHEPTGWIVDLATGDVFGRDGQPLRRVGTHGYRYTNRGPRSWLHHRVVWEVANGPIPAGMVINHLNSDRLDNRLANLELTTTAGNNRHMAAMGRARNRPRFGPDNHNYRITPEISADMHRRVALGESKASIARAFNVSAQTVARVIAGSRSDRAA